MVIPTTRGWLKLHGYMVVVCAVFTLVLGLDLWFDTLKTRSNLSDVWELQTSAVQSLLQQEVCHVIAIHYHMATKTDYCKLNCCGYLNSTSPPFVADNTCSSVLVAAQLGGCVGPLSTFANNYLDLIFTAAFGIVGESLVWRLFWIQTYSLSSFRGWCCPHSCRCHAFKGSKGEGEISSHRRKEWWILVALVSQLKLGGILSFDYARTYYQNESISRCLAMKSSRGFRSSHENWTFSYWYI